MSEETGSSSHTFLAFLLGAVAGAAVALLYAPAPGTETRERVGEKVREGKEKGRDLGARAKVRAREVADEAAEYLERQKATLHSRRERFSAAVEAGRDAYREEKGKED